MVGHRNGKRPRSVPKQTPAKSQVPEKLCKLNKKEKPIANISTSTASDSHLILLNEEKDCDVTFLVGPSKERIPCHQLFLKARSPVFQAMFSGRWNEGNKEIKIPDVDPVTFRAFLKFLYADKLVDSLSLALELVYVAQKYDVQLLVQKCEELFRARLTLEDCVEVIQRGRAYGNESLVKIAGSIVARADSLEVIAKEMNLKGMDKDTLEYLLMRDDMRAKEVELFKMALEWGKVQVKLGASSSVNKVLASVIPLIRYPTMTLHEFTTVVVPAGLLPQSTLVEIFTYFGSDESKQKDLAKTLKFSTAPREAQLAGALVSFYEGPFGREEVLVGIGTELEDYIVFRVNMPVRYGEQHNGRETSYTNRLAITGIILRFPATDDRIGMRNQDPSVADPRDFFKISIFESPRSGDYTDSGSDSDGSVASRTYESSPALVISPVKYEWGKVVEVKVEPRVVIRNGDECLIKLQQVRHLFGAYRYQSFGSLKEEEADLLDCEEITMTDVKTRSHGVRIIYKLRVMEE